ncbi:MAG TPA: PH domain-containing protein [Humisphaera sp.]|jgi:membrane protein YdbS with pleckstrin-like domain|nr:PH domain-containing protein [Humisphaera sp.]
MSDLEPHEPESTHPISAAQPHRPADDSEQVYFEGSPVIRGAVAKGLMFEAIGLLLIAIPLVIHFGFHRQVPLAAFAALIVAGLMVLAIPILRALTIRYRITNYRIDYERGLIGKDIDTLELWHVEDIQFHQSILERILGIGSISIMSHDDTTPKLVMHSLPNCRHLFEQLKQRIIAVKRQRGVLKMDTGT